MTSSSNPSSIHANRQFIMSTNKNPKSATNYQMQHQATTETDKQPQKPTSNHKTHQQTTKLPQNPTAKKQGKCFNIYMEPAVMNVGKRSFSITRVESAGDCEVVAGFLYDIYVKECKWTYFGKNNPAGLRVSTEGFNHIHDIPNVSRIGDTKNYLWDDDSFTSCPWAHTFMFRDVHTDKIVGTARLTERCPRRFKLPTELYNLPPSVREASVKADVEMSRLAVHSAYRGGLLLPIIYRYFFGLCNRARLTIFATVKQHNAMGNLRNMIQLAPAFHARDSSGNVLTFKYEPQDPDEVDVLVISVPVMRAAFSDYSAKLLLSRETVETNHDKYNRDKIMSR